MAGALSPIMSKADFVARFRPLDSVEDLLADDLLDAASEEIRQRFADAGVTLDEQSKRVRLVVLEVVRSALRTAAGDFGGLSEFSVTTDDATELRRFFNPSDALQFTEDHWIRLGLNMFPGPRGCFPVDDY